jgi:hypothetical protein
MFTYQQSTGEWRKNGELEGTGYSGHPPYVNIPSAESILNEGPIPRGFYVIVGPPFDDPKCGAYCLRLIPDSGTILYGRNDFLCHGDEIDHPGQELASDGCIILPLAVRTLIWLSGDRILQVIL